MEQTITNTSVDMFSMDLAELDKFISQSTRPNLKRQFEQYRQNIVFSLEDEKRKIEKSKQSVNEQTTTETIKELSIVYQTVSKYALDSGDKFVK